MNSLLDHHFAPMLACPLEQNAPYWYCISKHSISLQSRTTYNLDSTCTVVSNCSSMLHVRNFCLHDLLRADR